RVEMDVNWRWHTRLRGLLPLTPEALADDGRLVLVRPDELEVRKYQVLQADKGGTVSSAGSVTVETVRQMCVTADASVMVGVTDDDVYLFREGRKGRFLPERRVSYLSVALARSGCMRLVGRAGGGGGRGGWRGVEHAAGRGGADRVGARDRISSHRRGALALGISARPLPGRWRTAAI